MKFTNLAGLKTPGVYVREVSIFPPSIAQVPTAIPAFIGYTEKAEKLNKETLREKPWRISSMKEYTQFFGGSPKLNIARVDVGGEFQLIKTDINQDYLLYDCLQLYFANGGGDCYVVSIGDFETAKTKSAFEKGLDALYEEDEPTMLVFPDAANMPGDDLYDIQKRALKQCDEMMDRITICDLKLFEDKVNMTVVRDEFRNKIGMASLKYGAAYSPWLKSSINKDVRFRDINGKVFQYGAAVALDFKTLTTENSVKAIIDELTQIIKDSNEIQTDLTNYLNDATLVLSSPANPVKDIREGFERVAATLRGRIAAGTIGTAQNEYERLFKQIYKLLNILDNLTKAAETTNAELRTLITTSMAQLLPQIEKLLKLDNSTAADGTGATSTSINKPVGNVASFPLKTTLASLNAGGTLATAVTAAVATVVDTALYPNNVPANDAARFANMTKGLSILSEIFANIASVYDQISVTIKDIEKAKEASLLQQLPPLKTIISALNKTLTNLPPSAAMAGVYARVDNDLGVWNAPANVSLNEVAGLTYNMTDKDQEDFNVDVNAGKSINALRSFTGMGIMVWGARTLAGNDNEWRYVPVRRLFNMVEESVMKSTKWAVFKPNDANLWIKVKGMIDNYLTLLWRQGALAGAKPDEAFFCKVGLSQTMTSLDILEGRMIVQIGMAVVRPAEFIILEFSHKLQTS
jgi:phage tail sheath protein FI